MINFKFDSKNSERIKLLSHGLLHSSHLPIYGIVLVKMNELDRRE